MKYCSYYQAYVNQQQSWFVVAALKGYDHMSFDRTHDTPSSLFEFFVPQDMENVFLSVIKRLEKMGLITDLKKIENRLINQDF